MTEKKMFDIFFSFCLLGPVLLQSFFVLLFYINAFFAATFFLHLFVLCSFTKRALITAGGKNGVKAKYEWKKKSNLCVKTKVRNNNRYELSLSLQTITW